MQPVKVVDRAVILNVTIVCEAALLLVATCWCFIVQMPLAAPMHFSIKPALIGIGAGVMTATFGFFLLFLAERFQSLPFLSELRHIVVEEVAPLFAQLGFLDIFLISAGSGFCEEVFFRGVLQAQFGLAPSALLFGMVHCPSISMFPYAFFTFLAGLFLGAIYSWTQCLWTPILAHFTSNLIVLLVFRYNKQKNKAAD